MKLGKNENIKKGILFFLGFCLYGFFAIFVFGSKNISVSYSEPDSKSELRAIKTDFEYREVVELVEVEKKEEIVQEEVKGVSSNQKPGDCGSKFSIEKPQLFCGTSDISENAEIVIAEIHAPAVLFAGAEAPFDNLVQTNNPEGNMAFRNASEMINADNDYLIKLPPLPSSQENVLPEEDAYERFGMHFGVVGNVSKVDFDSKDKSKCPEVVNKGEFNVKNANALQDDLTRTFTPPGVMELGNRDYSGQLCKDETHKIDLTEDESKLLCTEGVWKKIENFFCEKLPTFKDKCDGLEGIVIDAPLGSGEVCNEEDCTVRYWESARINTSPPTQTRDLYPDFLEDSQKEEDYIVDDLLILTTPCKVRVDCKICETKCYWDISAWKHVFELEQAYTPPGVEGRWEDDDESTAFEKYVDPFEKELKRRGIASNL